jgi:hypothetical protein
VHAVALAGVLILPLLPFQTAVSGADLRGRVVDAATHLPVADARVTIAPAGASGEAAGEPRAARTAADGRFVFTGLSPGPYTMTVTMVGYGFVRRTIEVGGAGEPEFVIPLAEGTGAYRETVDVRAGAGSETAATAVSADALGSAAMQELRGTITDDPMRAVQTLPGVVTGDDFRAEFSVRGSAFRHVGVVVDDTASAVLMHTVRGEENTGSLAMINTDVLSGARLESGPHARRHGDWLGATLEFDVREGSRDRAGVRAAVSGTSASMVAEGPIGRDRRGSWLISLRRSYLDWLIRKVEPAFDSTLGFYDGHLKAAYDLTPRQQVQVLVVGGDSTYRESQASSANALARATAGSTLASVLWRYAGDRWTLRQRGSFVGSQFDNRGAGRQELGRGYTQAVVARTDAAVSLGRWTLDVGGLAERQRMNQVAREFRASPAGSLVVAAERGHAPRTSLRSAWAQLSTSRPAGSLAAGLRVSDRTLASRRVVSSWIVARRRAGGLTWRAGAGSSGQFPDPQFVFAPGETIRPETSAGADVGVERAVAGGTGWRVTAFYRSDADLLRLASEDRVDPETGGRVRASVFPAYQVRLDGTSRGVELTLLRPGASRLTGWVGYTWAHTRMRDEATGESFDADFDQRHTLNAVATFRLSFRTTVGAKLRIGSNVPIAGYFEGTPAELRLAALRNQVRLPVYARLDLRATRAFTFGARRLTLFLEVMNALGRDNYGTADGAIRAMLAATGYVERLIPCVPSAGMLIEF